MNLSEDMRARLIALYNAAEVACSQADARRHEISGAINWADLHCCDARVAINYRGEVTYEVLIEEADPGSDELRKFILDWLNACGFHSVDVVIEW